MAKAATIYHLKITLAGIKPPIWRRVEVKNSTLTKLHEVIQAAMGWTNTHLWAFDIAGEPFGDDPEDDMDMSSSSDVKLSDLVEDGISKFTYTYDFGDNWDHTVQIEKALTADPAVQYPRCLVGKRARPPEDCGGPWGYAELLDALKNPGKNPELLEWVSASFDPEMFDLATVNKELATVR